MKVNITTTNPEFCRAIGRSPHFTTVESFKTEPNGHKFKAGESRVLTGLVSYPEHNGETVREDGPRGKAYYVKGEINEAINWVYEDRLQ